MLPLPPETTSLLLAESPDLIALHAPDGTYRWASPAAQRILGFAPETLVGQPALRFVHPDDAAPVAAELAGLRTDPADAAPRTLRYRALRSDAAIGWVEARARAQHDPDTGALTNLVIVTRETKEPVVQSSLDAAFLPDWLGPLIEESLAGVTIFRARRDPDTAEIVDFAFAHRNRRARQQALREGDSFGVGPDTPPLLSRFPGVRDSLFPRYQAVLATGQAWEGEQSFTTPLGPGWFALRVVPLPDDQLSASWLDLTPARRLEARLAEERRIFETVFDLAAAGLIIFQAVRDAAGAVVDFRVWRRNPRARQLLNLAENDEGALMSESYPLMMTNRLFEVFARVMQTGVPWHDEVRYDEVVIDGSFDVYATRLDAEQLCVSFTDLTAVRQAEAYLIDAQAQLALATEATNLGVSIREIAIAELTVSPAFARLYGLPPETSRVALTTLLELTHPDDRHTLRPAFEAALSHADSTAQAQFRIHRADTGQERTLLSTARAEAGPDGQIRRILSITLDVTDLARARAATEQLTYWKKLTDGLPEMLWVADASAGVTQLLNQRWYDYTGHTEAVLRDQSWVRAIHPADLANSDTQRDTQEMIAVGKPYELKFRLRRHDGAWRWFLARAVPLRDAAGTLANWVGLTIDIHEREEAEQRLRRANADLDTFVYAAAHDLKSPIDNLEAIIGELRAEIAERRVHYLDEVIDRAQDELLKHATQAVARFRGTLSDLAQVVDTQAGFAFHPSALDLATHVADVALDMEAEFGAAQGRLCLDLDVGVVQALPARHLRSVLFNLISNALKYRSPDRPARLWLRTRAVRDGRMEISLTDNGLGLDPQRAARAFELFGRLHPGAAGGTGIGLFIVRRIVEQADGQLRVRGRVGEGTTFSIELPGS